MPNRTPLAPAATRIKAFPTSTKGRRRRATFMCCETGNSCSNLRSTDSPLRSQVLVNESVQAFAVTNRNLKCALIGHNDEDLAQAVVQHRALAAHLQVGLNFSAQNCINVAFNKI